MANRFLLRTRLIGALTAGLLLAVACGGGGGGGTVSNVGSGGTGFVSGVATKGPVGNANVTAYGIAGGQMGTAIGSATTDASGNFSMAIGSYAGPVMLQVSGGSYKDEATGAVMAMAPGDVMTALVPMVVAGANNSGVQVTPVTAMAQALALGMSGGMTSANIALANAAMGSYFSVADVLHVQPMNPLLAGSGSGASQDARNYGMALAAMSQYAKSLNMPVSSAVVTAMMNDAFDGMMDGRRGTTPITMTMGAMMGSSLLATTAGTSSLATAMATFMASPLNVSGVTASDMAALMQRLVNASGRL